MITTLGGAATDARRSSASHTTSRETLRDDTVTVGSFDFDESTLLAELYSQAIEHAGIDVRRVVGLGPREVAAPALAAGLIEFLPEYSGTALRFSSVNAVTPVDDPVQTRQQLVAALAPRHMTALDLAPAEDANAFVVTRATAERLGVTRLSDLERHAPDLVFGGPPECPSRPLCLGGLKRVYGTRFADVVELDAGGPLTKRALRSQAVDVALLFSSDPVLAGGDFVVLDDDRSLQPAENVVPLVRTEVVDRWGDALVGVVNALSARLDTATLRRLNAAVAGGRRPAAVAREWLRNEGLT